MPRLRMSTSLRGALGAAAAHRKENPVSLAPLPWDHGADGPANQAGLVEEPATEIDPETGKEMPNPNRVTRKRRPSWVEQYGRQGKLTGRQVTIAKALRDAAEGARNQDPLAAFGLKVDPAATCPDPLAAAYDARRRFHHMWPLVPFCTRPIVLWVVVEDNPVNAFPGVKGSGAAFRRRLEQLQDGLTALADRWGRT